jgi:lysyl-tRNA synthetase class II
MCGKEFCNAYTELNDPFEQRLRFEEQVRMVYHSHLSSVMRHIFVDLRSTFLCR